MQLIISRASIFFLIFDFQPPLSILFYVSLDLPLHNSSVNIHACRIFSIYDILWQIKAIPLFLILHVLFRRKKTKIYSRSVSSCVNKNFLIAKKGMWWGERSNHALELLTTNYGARGVDNVIMNDWEERLGFYYLMILLGMGCISADNLALPFLFICWIAFFILSMACNYGLYFTKTFGSFEQHSAEIN